MTLFLDQQIEFQSNVHASDAIEIKGIDYIEFYVGNALQAAHFFRTAFGFTPIAYAGPETGLGGRSAVTLQQGDIRLVLTAALTPEDPVSRFVALHGDGVRDIAFSVDDASAAFQSAVRRGATPVMEPTVFETADGRIVKATAATYGDTVHSFIERQGSLFLPGFEELAPQPVQPLGLLALDHAAVNVEAGTLERWVDFYRNTLGFHQSHQEDVSTEYSAMNSRVIQNRTGKVKFTLVEPAPGKRKSQIDEYLTFNRGAGTQHLAFSCASILETVRTLRALPLTPNGKVDRRALPTPEEESRPEPAASGAAPLTPKQAQLIRIWEEVLGVPSIGIHDNFFDIGGDSLVSVQLLGQLQKQCGIELSLTELLQAPTVAQLAERVAGTPSAIESAVLVPLQTKGDRPPLFIVHTMLGFIFPYYELVPHIGSDQPVYGLQARGMDGQDQPHSRLEEMASDYIVEIRRVQPQGPYFLAGWSMGALVAFEMARQLEKVGETVGMVAILDYGPNAQVRVPGAGSLVKYRLSLLRYVLSELRNGFLPAMKTYFLYFYSVRNSSRPTAGPTRQVSGIGHYLQEVSRLLLFFRKGMRPMFKVARANQKAERTYHPLPYGKRLTLLRAMEDSVLSRSSDELIETWSALAAGGVDLQRIPGRHITMMSAPYVQTVAKCLRRSIDQALQAGKD